WTGARWTRARCRCHCRPSEAPPPRRLAGSGLADARGQRVAHRRVDGPTIAIEPGRQRRPRELADGAVAAQQARDVDAAADGNPPERGVAELEHSTTEP